ncbi:hypothetical protein JCM8547_003646 [Rhodosporidiobolus lusitaniae]
MAPPRPQHLQDKLEHDDPTLLPDEDSDQDSDFVLGGEGDDSGSDSDTDVEDGRKGSRKKAKVEEAAKEPALTTNAIDDLWASFNDTSADPYASTSASAGASTSSGTAASKGKAKEDDKIKIEIEYEYVGEKITQEKLVARDSAEGQAWLARYPSASSTSTGKPATAPTLSTSSSSTTAPSASATSSIDALFGSAPSTIDTPAPSASSSSSSLPPPVPAPTEAFKPALTGGPRKRKTGGGLAAAAAKLGVGKPARLNTLEKSKLDWNKHVSTTGDSEDLANARKDGYLEKKDFLDRVAVSKEDEYERLKAGRRAQK